MNVRTVKSLYEALKSRNVEALKALSHPEIAVYQSEEVPWGGSYRGLEQALQFFGKVSSHLDSQVTVERMLDSGERVVMIGRTAGTVKATQQSFDVPVVHVWHVEDERISGLSVYLDHTAMLAALQAP